MRYYLKRSITKYLLVDIKLAMFNQMLYSNPRPQNVVYFGVKVKKSQTQNKRPHNNYVSGRSY